MKPLKLFLSLIIFMMWVPDLSAEPPAEDTQYLIIVADMTRPAFLSTGKIYISIDGQQYIEEKVPSKEVKGRYDYSYLIQVIKKFNREGWRLLNGDLSVLAEKSKQQARIFIMMTRKDPYGVDRTPIDTIYQDSSIRDNVLQRR